jgi:hypothetical protein
VYFLDLLAHFIVIFLQDTSKLKFLLTCALPSRHPQHDLNLEILGFGEPTRQVPHSPSHDLIDEVRLAQRQILLHDAEFGLFVEILCLNCF